MNNRRKKTALWWIAFAVMVISTLLLIFSEYLNKNGTSIDVFIFTLTAGTDGTDPRVIWDGFTWIFPRLMLQTGVMTLVIGFSHLMLFRMKVTLSILRKRVNKVTVLSLNRALLALLLVAQLVLYPLGSAWVIDKCFRVSTYLKTRRQVTRIYETSFNDPAEASVQSPDEKKNLIFIWVESLETTYTDAENSGFQEVNYIPRLTALARENTCFTGVSNNLSGLRSIKFAQFTFGAMFSALSGAPYAYTANKNTVSSSVIAPNEPFLFDFLKKDGYYSEYLMGSDSHFAGTDTLLLGHGIDRVLDMDGIIEEGYVPEDYFVHWGVEDSKLFAIAKDRITKVAENGQPFAYMLSTMDTHYPVGYLCADCPSEYDSDTANIVACTDRQVTDFVDWCLAQPFYENTVIIVIGDHPRMDDCLVKDVPMENRLLYNCILNSAVTAEKTDGREFSMMDMLPTTLSAMGYKIEGDRLGFGTDMFSGRATLTEEMGTEVFETEISKKSDYFLTRYH